MQILRSIAFCCGLASALGSAAAGETCSSGRLRVCLAPDHKVTTSDLLVRDVVDCACGTKTTCKEMDSCKEAYCFLEKCGLTRLDRDGDGVPCESICG